MRRRLRLRLRDDLPERLTSDSGVVARAGVRGTAAFRPIAGVMITQRRRLRQCGPTLALPRYCERTV